MAERAHAGMAAATLLVIVASSCDTSPVLDELNYGIVTLFQSEQNDDFELDALGFFYRAERAPLPDSRDVGTECTRRAVVTTAPPQPGFMRISAGDSIVVRAVGSIIRLRPTAEAARMRYERVEDDAVQVSAGQQLEVVVPGAAGGFAAATASSTAVASFAFGEIGVPAAAEPLPIDWTPAGDATTRMRIALRYATFGSAPNEELVCLVPDTGSATIPADMLDGWLSAVGGTRSATARRWRSERSQQGENLLMVYVQLDQPIPLAP